MTPECPAGLVDARRGGTTPDRYVVPTEVERGRMTALVGMLLRRSSERSAMDSKANALRYRIDDIPEIPGAVLLREIEADKRGGGAYAFRRDTSSKLVVQAPHTFFDEGTLPLSCEFFKRAGAAALFIDSAHRYKAAEADEQGEHPADVAHARDSLFQAATEGALAAVPGATVVQLHGFGPRESGAEVVVSSGVSRPNQALPTRARELLSPLVRGRVDRFPDESRELGATTNVQGELVRRSGGRFLHVEMSAAFRKTLLADPELRGRFLDALARAVESP
jgi:hypothetical protein